MPRLIHHQRFDAASTPAGWVFDSGMEPINTSVIRGARSLRNTVVNAATAAYWDTADSNSGDVRVRADLQFVSGTSTNTILEVFARATSLPYSGCSNYNIRIVPSAPKIALNRRVSGVSTEMAAAVVTPAAGVTYRTQLTCNGTAISGQVQRLSDGYYLTAAGAWQAAVVDFASVTNANVTGAGRAGIQLFQATSGNVSFRADEFVFETLETGVTVAVNDANLYAPILNHFVNGSVAYRSVNPGSYNKLGFSGTAITLMLPVSGVTGESRVIRWRVDGGAWEDYRMGNLETSIGLASGLSAGTHSLELWYNGHDPNQSIWVASPPMGLVVSGYLIDPSAASSAPTLLTNRAIYYGDSTAYGISSAGTGDNADPTQHDAQAGSPASYLMGLLNTEIAVVGLGSQGYGKAGLAGVPRVYDPGDPTAGSWDLVHPTRSRLSGGAYASAVDRVFVTHGTADYTNAGGTSTAQRMEDSIAAFLPAIRAAAPAATIYVVIPPLLGRNATDHNNRRNAILEGFDTGAGARTTHATAGETVVHRGSTDLNAYCIYLGETISANVWDSSVGATADSFDGIHYKPAFASTVADRIAAALALAVADPSAFRPRRRARNLALTRM